MNNWTKTIIVAIIFFTSCHITFGQNTPTNPSVLLGSDPNRRVITTGVPFLLIAPDARSGAMGDAGAAISPDANATHWGAAKLAFLETDLGVSFSFTPWLSKVINDMSISYLSAYKKINREQALAVSMRYFDLGDIQLTDNFGNPLQQVSPREFSLAATFAMKLSEKLSAGLTGRFIHSNLLAGASSNGNYGDAQPGISGAADVSLYYTSDFILSGNNSNISFAADISNIGAKITYLNQQTADFLPTNLRLGTAFTTNLDPFNKITFALDFNKLMVPTPPRYLQTSEGRDSLDVNGNIIIEDGKDPYRGLIAGMFGSFTDAPGGFKEELQEFMISFGVEYWYNDLFAVRAGYFHENQNKGNRHYFSAGIGLRYQIFGVDFAYLLPQEQNNPLGETLRVSLGFNLNTERQESVTDDTQ